MRPHCTCPKNVPPPHTRPSRCPNARIFRGRLQSGCDNGPVLCVMFGKNILRGSETPCRGHRRLPQPAVLYTNRSEKKKKMTAGYSLQSLLFTGGPTLTFAKLTVSKDNSHILLYEKRPLNQANNDRLGRPCSVSVRHFLFCGSAMTPRPAWATTNKGTEAVQCAPFAVLQAFSLVPFVVRNMCVPFQPEAAQPADRQSVVIPSLDFSRSRP